MYIKFPSIMSFLYMFFNVNSEFTKLNINNLNMNLIFFSFIAPKIGSYGFSILMEISGIFQSTEKPTELQILKTLAIRLQLRKSE